MISSRVLYRCATTAALLFYNSSHTTQAHLKSLHVLDIAGEGRVLPDLHGQVLDGLRELRLVQQTPTRSWNREETRSGDESQILF